MAILFVRVIWTQSQEILIKQISVQSTIAYASKNADEFSQLIDAVHLVVNKIGHYEIWGTRVAIFFGNLKDRF